MSYGISGFTDGRIGLTTAWSGVAIPSLRPSTYGWHSHLTKPRQPARQTRIESVEQRGRRLQIGMGHGFPISCTTVLQPAPFSTSEGGSKLTAYQSVELRWRRYRVRTLNPDYDGDDEEEDQDGADDMEDEDSETTQVNARTFNDRVGGRPGTKYDTQQIGDAEPANARQGRVSAMNRSRTTMPAQRRNWVRFHNLGSNTGERRRLVNPLGQARCFHNRLLSSRLGQLIIP